MNADFIRLANDRLTRQGLGATFLVGDFFAVQDAPSLDAAVFFESFHHCLNHLDLPRLLHRKTKDTGVLVFGGEPVTKDAGFAWGLRPDGMAVCSVHKFSWLELGFDEDYFLEALLRTGWVPRKFDVPACLPIYRATKTAWIRPGEVKWPADSEKTWAPAETDPWLTHRFTSQRTVIPLPGDKAEGTRQNFRPAPIKVQLAKPLILAPGEVRIVDIQHAGRLTIASELWRPLQEFKNSDLCILGVAVIHISP